MSTRDSDELIRARSLRSEADALVRIDEVRRVLLHISGLLTQHPGDARLLAEEKALLVDISTHRAAAKEAMRERGDLVGRIKFPVSLTDERSHDGAGDYGNDERWGK